jgi:adenylate cyclase
MPPMPFNQIQCADLTDWHGDTSVAGWRKVEGSVSSLLRGADPAPAEATQPTRRARTLSICVLPFVNMSGDAEQEYFSDGISEDIITDLSEVSALSVTARNTAFTFKGKPVDVSQVARQLNVSHVLEGSVRKAGNRVRITAQLIDGMAGDHVWGERFDRDLVDIFAIQDEISKEIVAALKLKLLPEEKRAIEQRGTSNAEAYNLYLMARKYWMTGNHGDGRREAAILRICRRAIELDPEYASAWALMAMAQEELRGRLGPDEIGGMAAAERALSLNPNLAEAHFVRADHFANGGRPEEAKTAINVALELDPESWEVNNAAGRMAFRRGDIPEAVRRYEKATTSLDTDFNSPGFLAVCYTSLNDERNARRVARLTVERAEQALAGDPNNGSALGHGAYSLAALGETERAREWIDRALLIDPDNMVMRYNLACTVAVHFDDVDLALSLMEPWLTSLVMVRHAEADPDLDRIRDDPRFGAMLEAAKVRLGGANVAQPGGAEA